MSINFSSYLRSGSSSATGAGLTPTTIKTSAYTAVANELVRCDTTAGAFSITFPTTPVDGNIIGVVDVTGNFNTANLTINRGGTSTIESDTSLILDMNGTYVSFVYSLTGTNWKLLETPVGILGMATVAPGTSGNLLTSNGTAWVSQASVAIGSGGSIISGSTTLTNTSNSVLDITPTALGQYVKLPDATTLSTGSGLYTITNKSLFYQLGIRDNSNVLREVLSPGGIAICNLTSKATTDGVWSISNTVPDSGQIMAEVARPSTYTNSLNSTTVVSLGTSCLMLSLSGSTYYAQAYDSTTNTIGTAVSIVASSYTNPPRLLKLTSTTALCIWQSNASSVETIKAAVISVSGSVCTVGAIASSPTITSWSSFYAFDQTIVVSPTLCAATAVWNNTGNTYYYSMWAISISGTTVTVGAKYDMYSYPSAAVTASMSGTCLDVLSPTSFYFSYFNYQATAYLGQVVSISGTTITMNASASITHDYTLGIAYGFILSTNSYLVLTYQSSQNKAYVFTVSGTTTTAGTAFDLGYNNNSFSAVTYDATHAFIWSNLSYAVLLNTAGTLSFAVPLVSYASGAAMSSAIGGLSVSKWISNSLYFAKTNGSVVMSYDGASTLTIGYQPNTSIALYYTTAGSIPVFSVLTTLKNSKSVKFNLYDKYDMFNRTPVFMNLSGNNVVGFFGSISDPAVTVATLVEIAQ